VPRRGTLKHAVDERLRYWLDDFSSRPERVRAARYLGTILGGLAVLGLAILLTHGRPPKPRKPVKLETIQPNTPGAVVRDAFAFAKDLESRLRKDQRFAKVYLVPSAADAAQKHGKVVVMGELASDEDLQALQAEAIKQGVPVPVEWQVTVPGQADH
jgi:hypothetical protein